MTAVPSLLNALSTLLATGGRILRAPRLVRPNTVGLFLGMTDDFFAV